MGPSKVCKLWRHHTVGVSELGMLHDGRACVAVYSYASVEAIRWVCMISMRILRRLVICLSIETEKMNQGLAQSLLGNKILMALVDDI